MAEQSAPPFLPDDSASARQEDLREIARSLYVELHRTPLASDEPASSSKLERDLGFDSLARAELLRRVEQRLSIRLPEATLSSVETFGDLLRAVASAAGALPASISEQRSPPSAISPRPVNGVPKTATTLNEVLEWHVRVHPGSTHAIVLTDETAERVTYGQLLDAARAVASGLARRGVEPGSTVALMLPTGKDCLHAFLGTLFAGAIPVPIYPPARRTQLEEHIHRHAGILENADAVTLITVPAGRGVGGLLRNLVPSLRSILSVQELSQAERFPTPASVPSASSVAMLQYTSGSTGAPKGVILTHDNLLANIRSMGRAVQATSSDVFVSWLPLYHDMGLIGAWLGSLYFGCLFVVMPPTSFLLRPASWLRAVHDYRATLSASPNFGYELCARRLSDESLGGLDLSSWRVAFNGAEPVSPDTMSAFSRRFARYGFHAEAMTPVYGLAEAAVGLTFPPLGRGPVIDRVGRDEMMRSGKASPTDAADALRFVSCGQPLAGYQVRIVDSGGSEAPERVEGSVEFAGPSATAGYYHNAAASAGLLKDEWRVTGDRGYMAGGELYITGRSKDIIIRRGRHIYPEELEQAVGQLDGIRKGCVAVFGANEPTTETEKLIVVAETRREDAVTLDRIKARVNQCVVDTIGEPPEEIVLVHPHTVLKTSSGKLRRAATRDAYEDGSLRRAPAHAAVQMLRLRSQSAMPTLRRILRSARVIAYGWCAWLLTGAFAVATGLGVLVLPSRAAWRLSHIAARGLIRILCISFSRAWLANADLTRPHIIVANHCSYVDSIFLAAALASPHCFVAKAELRHPSLLGILLGRIGTIFIERFEPEQSVAEIARLSEYLAAGSSLIVFPEGTFTRVTGLRPFHLGAFQVAAAAGVPIIPCALRGTRSVLRDGQRLIHRGAVTAALGTPIDPRPTDDSFSEAVRLRDLARDEILRHCGEPDLGLLPDSVARIQ